MIMHSSTPRGRAKRRLLGPGILLVASVGLAGCYSYYGEGYAEMPEQFCGLLYSCGSDSDSNRGGSQTATGESSDSSSSSSGSSTGGESAASTAGE